MDSANFNKLLKDKYFLLKDIAKKYDYSEELLDMITFIYISFYMDFGKKCDFPLYDLFNKVKIIYEQGTVDEISRRHNFGSLSGGSAAVTIFIPNLKVFDDSTLKQNPQTILLGTHVDDYLATPILKLEMLAHEVRHALMGYYNTNILLDDKTYYMRSGLQETFYTRDDNCSDKFSVNRTGTILDEVTNTYITELLVNRIMSFKRYGIDSNTLKRFLETLKTKHVDGRYRSIGYNLEVRLLYPILLNEMFINLVNHHQFDGDIEIVKQFINKNASDCNYEEFCKLLDQISENNAKYSSESCGEDFIKSHVADINRAKSIVLDINKSLVKKI